MINNESVASLPWMVVHSSGSLVQSRNNNAASSSALRISTPPSSHAPVREFPHDLTRTSESQHQFIQQYRKVLTFENTAISAHPARMYLLQQGGMHCDSVTGENIDFRIRIKDSAKDVGDAYMPNPLTTTVRQSVDAVPMGYKKNGKLVNINFDQQGRKFATIKQQVALEKPIQFPSGILGRARETILLELDCAGDVTPPWRYGAESGVNQITASITREDRREFPGFPATQLGSINKLPHKVGIVDLPGGIYTLQFPCGLNEDMTAALARVNEVILFGHGFLAEEGHPQGKEYDIPQEVTVGTYAPYGYKLNSDVSDVMQGRLYVEHKVDNGTHLFRSIEEDTSLALDNYSGSDAPGRLRTVVLSKGSSPTAMVNAIDLNGDVQPVMGALMDRTTGDDDTNVKFLVAKKQCGVIHIRKGAEGTDIGAIKALANVGITPEKLRIYACLPEKAADDNGEAPEWDASFNQTSAPI